MVQFANATPLKQLDGVPYATALVMPALEGDLFNQPLPQTSPVAVLYGEAVAASVELTVSGGPASQTTYVVLQTDLGDGVWYDIAWCVFAGVSGQGNFLLTGGVAGADAVQQTRAAGTAPASSGSIQVPLGGRIRFVGKTSIPSGSSSSSSSSSLGAAPAVTCTIRYKLTGLR